MNLRTLTLGLGLAAAASCGSPKAPEGVKKTTPAVAELADGDAYEAEIRAVCSAKAREAKALMESIMARQEPNPGISSAVFRPLRVAEHAEKECLASAGFLPSGEEAEMEGDAGAESEAETGEESD
jgi:hypothetical protein